MSDTLVVDLYWDDIIRTVALWNALHLKKPAV